MYQLQDSTLYKNVCTKKYVWVGVHVPVHGSVCVHVVGAFKMQQAMATHSDTH